VAVHVATLLAVMVYFFRNIIHMVPGREPFEEDWYNRVSGGASATYVYVLIAVTLIPLAIVYVFWGDAIESLRTEPYAVAFGFIYGGGILIVSDFLALRGKDRGVGLGIIDALLIGLAQAVALAPGVSRSGTTMATGRIMGLSKEAAFRFSFLMYIPAVAGAAVLKMKDMAGFENPAVMASGFVTAFFSGLLALAILRRAIERLGLTVFGIYCVVAGIVTIILRGYSS